MPAFSRLIRGDAAPLTRQAGQILSTAGLVRAAARVYLCTFVPKGYNMPSFDVVSDFDSHEARNGVDHFQLKQMMDILHQKLSKRGINIGCLDEQEPEFSGSEARQRVIMRRGIDIDRARKLVKQIKAAKLKVQAAIQGDKLRVSGKKRDDLQAVIAMLKETDIGLPLQYENFRD
jgi:uncharacterized protein YajQ (UPF0234 family)